MFKPLPIFVGLRYTRTKRRNRFISFISFVSIVGIVLGITALITVVSVMNGFTKEVRERILGVASHVVVSSAASGLDNWHALPERLSAYPEVVGVAPFVKAEGMLSANGAVSGTLIRGILPEQEGQVSDVGDKMLVGAMSSLRAGDFNIVLGSELANTLGLRVGDKVTLVTPQAAVTPVGIMPRLKRFTVSGVFEIGVREFDGALAMVHMEDAAKLFLAPGQISGIRLQLHDIFDAPYMTHTLVNELPLGYLVNDWTRQYSNFFQALRTEKAVMFIIVALVVVVAVFNIVSTLVMAVEDKRADIAILRTLGASPGMIMKIFVVQGTVIGSFGTVIGVVCGILLASNVETIVPAIESMMNTKFMPPDVYYISELPSEVQAGDVISAAVLSFCASIVATLYPAWRASRTQPAEALRYE